MKSKLLDSGTERTYALIFEIGDEVNDTLTRFAEENDLDGAHFTALGAFRDAKLGYWNWDTRSYEENPVDEQVEVVSLVGNVARKEDGSAMVHAHVVVARRDGSAMGGHLLEAHVRPTLELMLTEDPAALRRRKDETTGLDLIDPEA